MEASELRQRGQLPGQGLGTGGPGAEQELRQAGAPYPRDGGVGGTSRAGAGKQACPRDGQDAGGDPDADAASCTADWTPVNDTRRGRRRRSRRRLRRGRRSAAKTVDISIFDNNLNGYPGKRASIAELLKTIKPTIVTFQETAMAGNNKIKVKNYFSFQRNRKGTKTMGGVATLIANEVKQYAVKVKEGEDKDEYIVTRLNNVVPAINIINVYGGTESRMTKQEVLENWTKLKKEITEIKEREEWLVLIGDLNRAIGSGSLGVEGNHQGVSYGGGLVRELLDGDRKEYFLVNGLKETEGGPWTWVSRADSRVKSCIDLVIVSANLRPYV